MESAPALVIGLLVLALLLYRQVQVRRLADGRISLILIVIGLVELAGYGQHHPLGAGVLSIVAASLAASVLLGGVRAVTVRLWRRDGQVVRQAPGLSPAGQQQASAASEPLRNSY